MNGHFVHALIHLNEVKRRRQLCKPTLPVVQEEFGQEVSLEQVEKTIRDDLKSFSSLRSFENHKKHIQDKLSIGVDVFEEMNLASGIRDTQRGIQRITDQFHEQGIDVNQYSLVSEAVPDLYRNAVLGKQLEFNFQEGI